MNTIEPPAPATPLDVRRLAGAIRFALVAIIVGISYFGVRSSLSIGAFEQVFADMLGARPLPALTQAILGARLLFIGTSILVPVAAIGTLFWTRIVASFYLLGVLSFIAIVEVIVLYHGLSAPLFQIIQGMSGGA